MVRAVASRQCKGSSPGFDVICGSSLMLVPSPLLREVFLRVLRFSPSQKPTFPNSNSTVRNQVTKNRLVEVLPLNRYLFLYFFYFIYLDARGLFNLGAQPENENH